MRLCSGKMWKSNVKKKFFLSFPTLACLSDVMPCSTQAIAQLLKTQQNSPKVGICQTAINTCLIIDILSLWLIWNKKKKKSVVKKLSHFPENNHSHWDTMTGTNSSNDSLKLWQNVEMNSNEYFSYFFGNEIVNHVAWKCHCAITKKNIFLVHSFRVISMIYYGLSNIDVIFHLFIICYDWCHFPQKWINNRNAIFCEMCPAGFLHLRTNEK